MHIETDWVIHVANLLIEFFVFPVLAILFVYIRFGGYYKSKRILGYYRDIKNSTGTHGTAIVKISFHFPSRIQIQGLESNNVAWIGEDYKYFGNDLRGTFDWNRYGQQARQFIADYGNHEIHIVPKSNPRILHVITVNKSGNSENQKSTWERVNDLKIKKELRQKINEFLAVNHNPPRMLSYILNQWKIIREKQILSLIVSGIITMLIIELINGLYSIVKKTEFDLLLNNINGITISSSIVILLITFFKLINKNREGFLTNLPENTAQLLVSRSPDLPLQQPVSVPQNLLFDSNIITNEEAWTAYGQQIWDQNVNQLSGKHGVGSFHINKGILTIDRTNVEGRYIISIKIYYYRNKISSYVPANIYGKRIRDISVRFSIRSLANHSKIILVFKRNGTHDWLNSFPVEMKSGDWEKQACGFTINNTEDFVIEFHSFMLSDKPGIIQIKDLVIEESGVQS